MIKNFGFTNARLSARVAAVVGGTALSLISTVSMAAIVDSGVVSIAVPVTLDGIYLNVVTATTGATGGTTAGWDFNPYATAPTTGSLNFFSSTTATNNNQVLGTGGAQLLAAGDTVGPARSRF